jgi:hypothetical protein
MKQDMQPIIEMLAKAEANRKTNKEEREGRFPGKIRCQPRKSRCHAGKI